MIQNSLIEYVTTQKKMGVAREAIASALVGVGWQAVDVEDTLKKVESDAALAPARSPQISSVVPATQVSSSTTARTDSVKPAMSVNSVSGMSPNVSTQKPISSSPASSFPSTGMSKLGGSASDVVGGISGPKTSLSQPIRMGDFMKTGTSSAATSSGPSGSVRPNVVLQSRSTAGAVVAVPSGKKMATILEVIVIIVLAGLSVFLYVQNASLSGKVSDLTTAAGGTSGQASDLQNQLQTLNASQTTLQGQVADLTATNTDLATELSFLVAPSGTSVVVASGTVTGLLASSASAKGAYAVRTQYNLVVYVKNANDAKVAAILKPLINTSVTLAGTYVPGSDALTVVTVNGNLVNPPVVATTTASSTPMTVPASAPSSTASSTP